MNIGWAIYDDPSQDRSRYGKELVYFEPEPMWPALVAERRGSEYIRCPAVSDYFDNTFVIRCPYDITFTYNQDTKTFASDRFDEDWYKRNFYQRVPPMVQNDQIKTWCLTIRINYVFVADQDVEIESQDVPLLHSAVTRNIRMVPGRMNIHRWVRPIDFSFEVVDLNQPIELKRGDPMFAIRFRTDEKVRMKKLDYDTDMRRAVEACVGTKTWVPNKSLRYRYEMAKRLLQNKRWL
jgi:hypothetical protein